MKNKDGILSGELSAAIGLSRGRSSNIIKSLERKGYLTRTTDQTDARQVHIRLTEAGADRAREQYDKVIDITVRLLLELGEEDADEFLRIVERIAGFNEE